MRRFDPWSAPNFPHKTNFALYALLVVALTLSTVALVDYAAGDIDGALQMLAMGVVLGAAGAAGSFLTRQ